MSKRVDESIDESILRRFGLVESMENDRFAKRAYVGKSDGIRSTFRKWKRWTDTVNN